MTQLGYSVGQIAERLGVPVHRVEYLLRTRWGQLRPAGRIGNAWVYSDSDLQFIRGELNRIDAEKEVNHAS